MSGMRLSMRVWDAPTRLFHWAIVVLVACSYVSVQIDWMNLHYLSGYSMFALLLFRLVWGFVGSDTARFRSFLVSPLKGLMHLARFGRREPDNQIGHNAAGGWMVVVLLLLLAFQVASGLFSSSDAFTEGPFAKYVGDSVSGRVAHLHGLNFNLLLAAITLHVLAVIAYAVVKRQNLLRPMITGKKRMPAAMRPPRMASPLLALLVLICAAGAVTLLVRFF